MARGQGVSAERGLTDERLVQTYLGQQPFGRTVYQPHTGRSGVIWGWPLMLQSQFQTAVPWVKRYHRDLEFFIIFVSEAAAKPDCLTDADWDKLQTRHELAFIPGQEHLCSAFSQNDGPRLPPSLQRKFVTASEFVQLDSTWSGRLDISSDLVFYLRQAGNDYKQPVFLGNTFWAGFPNPAGLWSYDIRLPPSSTVVCTVYELLEAEGGVLCNELRTATRLVHALCAYTSHKYLNVVNAIEADDISEASQDEDAELESLVNVVMQAQPGELDADVEAAMFDPVECMHDDVAAAQALAEAEAEEVEVGFELPIEAGALEGIDPSDASDEGQAAEEEEEDFDQEVTGDEGKVSDQQQDTGHDASQDDQCVQAESGQACEFEAEDDVIAIDDVVGESDADAGEDDVEVEVAEHREVSSSVEDSFGSEHSSSGDEGF